MSIYKELYDKTFILHHTLAIAAFYPCSVSNTILRRIFFKNIDRYIRFLLKEFWILSSNDSVPVDKRRLNTFHQSSLDPSYIRPKRLPIVHTQRIHGAHHIRFMPYRANCAHVVRNASISRFTTVAGDSFQSTSDALRHLHNPRLVESLLVY